MNYDDFVKLMDEESILTCMRGIDEISIPTILNGFKRKDEKYLNCLFCLETSNFEKIRYRREVLSTLYLMSLLGTEVYDLFTPSGEINEAVLFLKNSDMQLVDILYNTFNGLSKEYYTNLNLYYSTLGEIAFDWYTIDKSYIEDLNIENVRDYTFSVNDFNEGDMLKKLDLETENIIEEIKKQTSRIASDEGVDDYTWSDLYSRCSNIKNKIDIISDNMILDVMNICDKYVNEKLNKLREYAEYVDDELLLAANVEEIRLYLHNEIRTYVNNIRDIMRSTIDIRVDSMRLLQRHMKY